MGNIVFARGLSEKEIYEIQKLEDTCCENEKLNMKLNWDDLEKRPPDKTNDFLYYEGDRLIGFLGLYSFGVKPKEIEITGMVHPDYRRKGIFRELFDASGQEYKTRGVNRLLLITERSSDAGTGFVKSTGSKYAFSEYRMKFDRDSVPDFTRHGITLRKACRMDFKGLIQLDELCFGSAEADLNSSHNLEVYESTYIAELEGSMIGKISASMEGENGYIFGFVIVPEMRGLGYGREVLSLVLQKLISEQINVVLLEVAVKNENALSLYKSCGFKEITVYDYYETVL